jgi:hypothetical protein
LEEPVEKHGLDLKEGISRLDELIPEDEGDAEDGGVALRRTVSFSAEKPMSDEDVSQMFITLRDNDTIK